MNWLQDNMDVLLKTHAYIGQKLSIEPDADLRIEATQSGSPTATYKGIYIHSKHNPLREARQLMEAEVKSGISSCVFYGFGLGYQVEAFIHANPGVPVLVIEGDPSFFRKALEARDLRFVLRSPHVRFFFRDDPESIVYVLEEIPLANIQVIKIRSVFTKDEEYYRQVDDALQSHITKKEINLNTLRRFGKRWVANLTRNLRHLIIAPGISSISGFCSGLPGIVLASGPSLETILPMLRELSQRLVIISVDTSLGACLRAGVEPDFLVIVDPQYWNTRHIDWTHTSKSILVSESSTHPRIFHLLDLPLFFSGSFFPLGQFFESIAGEKGKIGAGGSVATAAWDIARILGLDPIYMAGLDLGYPLYKTHFKGAFFEQTFHTVSYKLRPSETYELAYLLDAGPFFAPSNSDGLTLTDKRMNVYKWWFETQMQIYRDTHSYNLSASGIKVEGMDLRRTDELLLLPVIRHKIDGITERLRKYPREQNTSEIAQKTENMKNAINGLLTDLDRLRSVAGEGLDETKKARKRITGGKISEETVIKLDAVDRKIRGESSRIIAGFLLQPIIQGIMNSPSKSQGAEGVLETTARLYLELKESSEFHYEVLHRANREL